MNKAVNETDRSDKIISVYMDDNYEKRISVLSPLWLFRALFNE